MVMRDSGKVVMWCARDAAAAVTQVALAWARSMRRRLPAELRVRAKDMAQRALLEAGRGGEARLGPRE